MSLHHILDLKSAGNPMTPEGIVVAAVEQYFSHPKFRKFSIKKEYTVQMGSSNRRADVVLVDSKGNLAAIAECKKVGVEGDGINQLKSYLSATHTIWGIFANSEDSNKWKFYKNLGKNQFKENLTQIEFERGMTNSIGRVLDFFFNLFRRSSKDESVVASSLLNPPDQPVVPPEPSIGYIRRYQPLQNGYREDIVKPSLNGKPYYSEENGFYWAANHQGIAECVPQHIKRIIHNEELEIASTRDEIEQEINYLHQNVTELEEQQQEYQREIGQRTQDLARKREELAGLEIQLQTFMGTGLNLTPTEEVHNSSTTELNLPPVEGTPDDSPILLFQTEIEALVHERDNLEHEFSQKIQELARKKEELAGLEVLLQAPTEIELNPSSIEEETAPAKYQFSRVLNVITAIISTLFFVFLASYLFVFYASAVDKAFFLNTEKIQAQLTEGTYAGINDIVNPTALAKAFQGEWNPFIFLFPFIFLAFAIALDYFWEASKKGVVVVLAALTLAFDILLAIQISQKINLAKVLMGQETGEWSVKPINPLTWDLNIWTVIFCGFVVSMLVSIIYHVMNERWKVVSPLQETSTASDMHELEIKNEKTQREARIAVLKTETENLQKEITQLEEKEKASRQKIIKAVRAPVETRTVVLKTEMENLRSEIEKLNERDKVLQQEIDGTRAEILEKSGHRNKRVVNRNKMESQINQFLNGWCRFVAHSGDGTSEVTPQIDKIKQVAKETLDHYYQGAPDYSA